MNTFSSSFANVMMIQVDLYGCEKKFSEILQFDSDVEWNAKREKFSHLKLLFFFMFSAPRKKKVKWEKSVCKTHKTSQMWRKCEKPQNTSEREWERVKQL